LFGLLVIQIIIINNQNLINKWRTNKMASTIKVDQIEGSTGSTITVPTGQTLTLTDGLASASLPVVGVAKGGTNISSFAAGDILYATGATTLTKLVKGSAADVLTMNAGATAPEWAASAGGGGKVLQVATVEKNDRFSVSSTTPTDVTDLTLTLTPAATTSKFLIIASFGSFQCSGDNDRAFGRIKQAISGGATTYPFLGDAATGFECVWCTCLRNNDGTWAQIPLTATHMTGAIGTISAVTFTVQAFTDSSGPSVIINQSDGADANSGNTSSTFTVMEIGA
jgi:hypothetical protein